MAQRVHNTHIAIGEIRVVTHNKAADIILPIKLLTPPSWLFFPLALSPLMCPLCSSDIVVLPVTSDNLLSMNSSNSSSLTALVLDFQWLPMSFQWLSFLASCSCYFTDLLLLGFTLIFSIPEYCHINMNGNLDVIDGNILLLSPFDINGKGVHKDSPCRTAPPVMVLFLFFSLKIERLLPYH